MSSKSTHVVIIGAGIIGLSTAYKLLESNAKIKLTILEKEPEINLHQTGRNSGVIHSGIYYKQGSYKSKNCISGYHLMLDFLKKHDIPYKLTGKAIVATNSREQESLEKLYQNGLKSGLKIRYLEKEELSKIQKGLTGSKAIWVPETGLTDYKKVTKKLLELVTQKGGRVIYNANLKSCRKQSLNGNYKLETNQGTFDADCVINTAGLECDRVFKILTGRVSPIKIVPFKGEYYTLKSGSYRSEIPIYPVPNPDFPFLGIHITKMIDGTAKLGPNAVLVMHRHAYGKGLGFNLKDIWATLTTKGLYKMFWKYRSVIARELIKQSNTSFYIKSVQKYWPAFNWDMVDGYKSGIRAQALDKNGLVDDFVYQVEHNQIHILNAPSPAATSAFAIANEIVSLFKKQQSGK